MCPKCAQRFICPFSPDFNGTIFKYDEGQEYDFWAFINPKQIEKMKCVKKKFKAGKKMYRAFRYNNTLDVLQFKATSKKDKERLSQYAKTIVDSDDVEY